MKQTLHKVNMDCTRECGGDLTIHVSEEDLATAALLATGHKHPWKFKGVEATDGKIHFKYDR